MGSCCSHGRVAGWTDDGNGDGGVAREALEKLREKKRRAAEACTVVKVKISKKQLEELLRSSAGVNGGGGVEVDDRLLIAGIMSRGVVCHVRRRPRRWAPELQPVPEMAGEDGCL